MAKAALAAAKNKKPEPPSNKSKAVTTRGSTAIGEADDLTKLMAADTGKGVSTAIEDNVVPLIYILQALSPQTQKKKEEYIDKAEAGNIWFRGTKTVVGDEGISVVPCFFSKVWIEWMPNRGGFVARHDDRPEDAVLKADAEDPTRKHWYRKNGNLVVETREHVVLVLDAFDAPTPFVIPMSGSGHSASRGWMGLMNRKFVLDEDGNVVADDKGNPIKASSFAYVYRMKTLFRTNDRGDWFTWEIEDEGGQPTWLGSKGRDRAEDTAIYRMARQIEADFSKGTLKAAVADVDDMDTDVSGTDSETGKHI
jgi:hypothetical protein